MGGISWRGHRRRAFPWKEATVQLKAIWRGKLGWFHHTWGDNISVLSDFISLPADNNTDNSGPKEGPLGGAPLGLVKSGLVKVE